MVLLAVSLVLLYVHCMGVGLVIEEQSASQMPSDAGPSYACAGEWIHHRGCNCVGGTGARPRRHSRNRRPHRRRKRRVRPPDDLLRDLWSAAAAWKREKSMEGNGGAPIAAPVRSHDKSEEPESAKDGGVHSASTMPIFVQTTSPNGSAQFRVNASESAEHLLRQIAERESVPSQDLRLVLHGKELCMPAAWPIVEFVRGTRCMLHTARD